MIHLTICWSMLIFQQQHLGGLLKEIVHDFQNHAFFSSLHVNVLSSFVLKINWHGNKIQNHKFTNGMKVMSLFVFRYEIKLG